MRVFSGLTAVILTAAPAIWVRQQTPSTASLRGIHAVNESVAWATGTGGTVMLTMDGGASWRLRTVEGASALDFRDVEAFDSHNAVILSAGSGRLSRIYKTTDGGGNWALTYQNHDEKGFFDAISFWDRRRGLALGDPVNGRFTVLYTDDGGMAWRSIAVSGMPPARDGEGAFAASGTCLTVGPGGRAWFGTGGVTGGRVFRSVDYGQTWTAVETPIRHDSASSGIFSVAFAGNRGVAAGGDYQKPDESRDNVVVSNDGGLSWNAVSGQRPGGFRSAVAFVPGRSAMLIATGTSGSDESLDGGLSWRATNNAGFNAISLARRAGWVVGSKGVIARIK